MSGPHRWVLARTFLSVRISWAALAGPQRDEATPYRSRRRRLAAEQRQHLPRDVTGVGRRGEEDVRRRHLLRLGRPAQRRLLAERGHLLGRLARRVER